MSRLPEVALQTICDDSEFSGICSTENEYLLKNSWYEGFRVFLEGDIFISLNGLSL